MKKQEAIPAMAAELTDRVWTGEELLSAQRFYVENRTHCTGRVKM